MIQCEGVIWYLCLDGDVSSRCADCVTTTTLPAGCAFHTNTFDRDKEIHFAKDRKYKSFPQPAGCPVLVFHGWPTSASICHPSSPPTTEAPSWSPNYSQQSVELHISPFNPKNYYLSQKIPGGTLTKKYRWRLEAVLPSIIHWRANSCREPALIAWKTPTRQYHRLQCFVSFHSNVQCVCSSGQFGGDWWANSKSWS